MRVKAGLISSKKESPGHLDESVVFPDSPHEALETDRAEYAARQTEVAENIGKLWVNLAFEELQEYFRRHKKL